MIKRLEEAIRNQMKALPETGMGFQVVNATYYNNERRELLVINGSILLEEASDTRIFSESGFSRIAASSQFETNIRLVEIKRRSNIVEFSETIRASRSMGANDSSTEYTTYGERFIRFTAFGYDDYKLDVVNMCLLEGAFAAPYDDATYCLSLGLDIIDRYALPNNYKITHKINISPLPRTTVKRGIVQPAYGRSGGGKEVIFPNGTDNNTVTSIDPL